LIYLAIPARKPGLETLASSGDKATENSINLGQVMKNLILALVAAAALTSTGAVAQTGYTYLGPAHCQILAGNAGFVIANYGGYVDGIYYFNACFGSVAIDGGGGGSGGSTVKYLEVWMHSDEDKTACIRDIEWASPDVVCRPHSSYNMADCRVRSRDVSRATSDIEFVRCVKQVIGPFDSSRS
jgi:hypothetical protein